MIKDRWMFTIGLANLILVGQPTASPWLNVASLLIGFALVVSSIEARK